MKVLIPYADLLNEGGMPSYARGVAIALSRAGHDVLGVSVAQSQQSESVRQALEVPVRTIPKGWRGRATFRAIVDEFRPRLVHLVGGPRHPVHWGWTRYLRARGIPYVISGCGNLSEGSFRYRWGGKPDHPLHYWKKKAYFYAVDRRIIRDAAAVHANAENEAELARRLGAQHTIIVPFGIDEDPGRGLTKALERSCENPVTFTYIGRLSPAHKGLDLAIEAFGKVVAAGLGERFRLILAGPDEGGSLNRLRQQAEAQGITNFSLPGRVGSVERQRIWDETAYFLNLCRFNGFARTAREALCQGIPMVATIESDYGDWISAQDMGVVAPLDSTGLARVITDLLTSGNGRYERWIRNVTQYVAQTDVATMGRSFAEEYERVLASLQVRHVMGSYTPERPNTARTVRTRTTVSSQSDQFRT